jgi:hypothetical protein
MTASGTVRYLLTVVRYELVVKVESFENHPPGAKEAAEKLRRAGESPEKHPSGAKARVDFTASFGTAEAVPFQNTTLTTGC